MLCKNRVGPFLALRLTEDMLKCGEEALPRTPLAYK
jgi:hypothetical protein